MSGKAVIKAAQMFTKTGERPSEEAHSNVGALAGPRVPWALLVYTERCVWGWLGLKQDSFLLREPLALTN